MKKLVPVIVVASALFVGACSSGSTTQHAATIDPTTSSTASSSTTVTTAKSVAPKTFTDADLQAALLAVDDLPSGYSTSPPSDKSKSSSDDDFCQKWDKSKEQADVDVSYQKSSFGPFVGESMGGFATADDAHTYMTQTKAIFQACQSFDQKNDDGTTSHVTLAPLSFKKFGDETLAVRLSVMSPFGPVSFDFAVVRKGRIGFLVSAGGIGGATEDLEPLVTRAVEKVGPLAG